MEAILPAKSIAQPIAISTGSTRSKLFLTWKDPQWLFACWTATKEEKARFAGRMEKDFLRNATWAIRIIPQNHPGNHYPPFFVFPGSPRCSHYIHITSGSGQYRIAYGLLGQDYTFFPMLYSNTVDLPVGTPRSPKVKDVMDKHPASRSISGPESLDYWLLHTASEHYYVR